jgi:glycosyltransferase involved in cell wall biosynthesis
LRDALVRFLDEPGLWERLRASGLAAAPAYSWKGVADTQFGLYRLTAR